MEAFKKADYKVRLEVKNAKVKVDDPVDTSNELSENLKIDGLIVTDDPPTQPDYTEGNADTQYSKCT